MLVGGFCCVLVARFVTDEVITVANVFGFSAVFTAVFARSPDSHPYRRRREPHHHPDLRRPTAAQCGRRCQAAATAGFTAMLGLSGLAAGAAGAMLGGVEAGDTSTIPATIVWATGFAVLAGLLGLGIGFIARQSAAAISGVLVWWLVIENLVAAFAPERIVRFMPFFAGNGMLDIVDEAERIAFDRPITVLILLAMPLLHLPWAPSWSTATTHDPFAPCHFGHGRGDNS